MPVETEATTLGTVLNLGEGVWQVQAFASGYWSQAAEVAVDRQANASLQLTLWPAASLRGNLSMATGDSFPEAIELRLSATPQAAATSAATSPAQRTPAAPSHAELRCPVQQGTWTCPGPAGIFDLRLKVTGYAPRYEWGVRLEAGQSTDLGRTVLRRAASVFGRAVRKDGSNPPGPCLAVLRPDRARRSGPPDAESAPPEERSFAVPLNDRGYFQVVGVLDGRHVLSVECPTASVFRELRVQAQGETQIDPPLQLEELTLDVAVTPKVDAQGRPWRLTVDETSPRYRRIANRVAVSSDGRWLRPGLTTGNYRVVVSTPDGTKWLERYFKLGANSGPLLLQVAAANVAGRVRLNMQPVRARLVFFNDAGGRSTTLISDDDGRFQGLLPVPPNDQESTWTVEARVAEPPVTRRLLGVHVPPIGRGGLTWLDLDLPTVAVRGSVVSQDGQAQAGAQVTLEDSSGARMITGTDDAGKFELSDLRPGKYIASADSPEGVSDHVPLEISEGKESELKLVLSPSERTTFYVMSSQGPVPDAAVQVWIPPGMPRAFARTDQEGRFEVKLPPGTREVGLTVGAPGYALKLTRLPLSSDGDTSPEAHTVKLEESGGTLTLNFHAPGRTPEAFSSLYLVHDGAVQDARTLPGWGTEHAGAVGDGPGVIEAIEPGTYALCRMDPDQVTLLWSGPPLSDRCRSGSLEQGETLTLSPP